MKQLLSNRYAHHSYEILETLEAGIRLSGNEVKSLKSGHGSLKEAFVVQADRAMSLVRMYLPPFQPKNAGAGYDPYQARQLLVHKKQMESFLRAKAADGLTIIPLSLYEVRGLIKVQLALVRGRKLHDKRELLKSRESDRDIARTLKRKI
jgi:SsrA-binding protein